MSGGGEDSGGGKLIALLRPLFEGSKRLQVNVDNINLLKSALIYTNYINQISMNISG